MVVDSNVWVSAAVFGGVPERFFEFVAKNSIFIVVSAELETEVDRILHSKFPLAVGRMDQLKRILVQQIQLVQLGSIRIDASRDPKDNYILETAILGGAAYIITGDKDLLVLDGYRGLKICTPAQFIDRIS